MRAIRLKPAECPNPAFSVRDQRAAKAAGEKYDTPQFIEQPVGQELDDPHCWRLCVSGMAAPADDECRQRVLAYLGDPGRRKLLEQIRALRAADGVQTLPKRDKRWLEMMEKSYAIELGLAPAPPPADPLPAAPPVVAVSIDTTANVEPERVPAVVAVGSNDSAAESGVPAASPEPVPVDPVVAPADSVVPEPVQAEPVVAVEPAAAPAIESPVSPATAPEPVPVDPVVEPAAAGSEIGSSETLESATELPPVV